MQFRNATEHDIMKNKVKSKLSPIRGESVDLNRYRSHFVGMTGATQEQLLEAHLMASSEAFPHRWDEFFGFYEDSLRDLLEAKLDSVRGVMVTLASYEDGKAAAFRGEPCDPEDCAYDTDAFQRGYNAFNAWEREMLQE